MRAKTVHRKQTAQMKRVQDEWARRTLAEHQSAAITSQLLTMMFGVNAPPELLSACQRIVEDELTHSRLCAGVLQVAGGVKEEVLLGPPVHVAGTEARQGRIQRVAGVCAAVMCCGESVAVPLFLAMRSGATQPEAVAALQRILRDEGRHRAFGWQLLGWLIRSSGETLVPWLKTRVPDYVAAIWAAYAHGTHTSSRLERGWGLIPAGEYRRATAAAIQDVMLPRFNRLGLGSPRLTAAAAG